MIISIISDIKKIVFEIALFILVLTGILYALLIKGVEVDHIKFGHFKINKLYLKLDKKLIVKAKGISLPLSGSKKKRLPDEIVYLRYIPKLFQHIELQNIILANNSISLAYKDGLFYFKTNRVDAVAKLYNIDKKLFFDLKSLIFIPWNLKIKGSGKIVGDALSMSGHYNFENIKGSFLLTQKAKQIDLSLNSKPFTNKELAKIFSHFTLHPQIKVWSSNKIKAKRYRVIRLILKGTIDHLSTKNVTAIAEGVDVDIRFHPKLPPAYVKRVQLSLKNDNLTFKLFQPVYEGKKLDGSWVKIHSLSRNSFIDIDLKVASAFDHTIKRVIEAFGVEIPLLQKRGLTHGELLVTIHFQTLKTRLQGKFHARRSLFQLAGIDLYSDNLFLKLNDKRIIIKNFPISLPPIAEALCQGYFDIGTKSGKFRLQDLNISIEKEGMEILKLHNLEDTLAIDTKEGKLRLPRLGTIYDFKKRLLTVEHIEDYKSKSPLLSRLDPIKANLLFQTNSGRFTLSLLLPDSPLLLSGKTIKHFDITGDLKQKSFHINDQIDIKIDSKINVKMRDLSIRLEKSKKKLQLKKPLLVKFQNIEFLYGTHKLPIPQGYFRYNKGKFFLYDKLSTGSISIKKETNLTIEAKSIDSKTLDAILGKHIFDKGLYDLQAQGNEKGIEGRLTIKEGYMKELKLLNNFFAFLNTIPALVTLSNPGFNTKGLPIHRGQIDFLYNKDLLILKNIDLRSDALNIKGKGIVDLQKKRIDMLLHLQTLKNVSAIIKHIPIAGYIVLGKDGTISTAVKVSGSLEDPKFSSKLPQETIKLPFKIIKRTLELPFKLFE